MPFSNRSNNFLSLILAISSVVYILPVVGSYLIFSYLCLDSLESILKLKNKSKKEIKG